MANPHDRSNRLFLPSVFTKSGPTPLTTQVSYRFGVPLIYVSGELDHASSPTLREVIRQELSDEVRVLLLELSEVGYIDSGGLGLLFDTVRQLRNRGWAGAIAPNPNVQRMFELTGLADLPGFRLFPDLRGVPAAVTEST
jgi:anti-sigma B factor antagonist